MELYLPMMGNESYVTKVMGLQTTWDNYCIGWVILTFLLVIVVGPFVFFSDMGGFVQFNQVQSSQIIVAFIVNKTLSLKNLTDRSVPAMEKAPTKAAKGSSKSTIASNARGRSSIDLDQLYSQ